MRATVCPNECEFVDVDGSCAGSCGGRKYERATIDNVIVYRCLGSARCPSGYFATEEDEDLCVRECAGVAGFLDPEGQKCVVSCEKVGGASYFALESGLSVCAAEKCAAFESAGPGLRRCVRACPLFSLDGQCVEQCPARAYRLVGGLRVCAEQGDGCELFVYEQGASFEHQGGTKNRLCVARCPLYHLRSGECVMACAGFIEEDGLCVSTCKSRAFLADS